MTLTVALTTGQHCRAACDMTVSVLIWWLEQCKCYVYYVCDTCSNDRGERVFVAVATPETEEIIRMVRRQDRPSYSYSEVIKFFLL